MIMNAVLIFWVLPPCRLSTISSFVMETEYGLTARVVLSRMTGFLSSQTCRKALDCHCDKKPIDYMETE